jgi:hypothetical protein
MNRDEAFEALEYLRRVVKETRDDSALQNWGVIWMVHAFTNGAGFAFTGWLLDHGRRTPGPYIVLWTAILAANLTSIALLRRRRAGARSFVETQLWAIWTAFVGAVAVSAFLNYLLGLDRLFLGPVIAVLAAVAFASMGSLMGNHWYGVAVLFLLTAFVMSLLPAYQFYILGAVWLATKFSVGLLLDRSRRERESAAAAGPRVV